jgi:hypothetical protein
MSKASNAAGLNMEESVAQRKDALLRLKLAPLSFEPIHGAVDTSGVAVTHIRSLSNTWDPLLQKVRLFCGLVDKIAHVSQVDELCGL